MTETMTETDKELSELFIFKKKKKNKDKDKDKDNNHDNQDQDQEPCNDKAMDESHEPPYSYMYLLNRLYEQLEQSETSTKINQKLTLKMPIVQRSGAKKTAWINFIDCAKNMNREKTHIQTFINSELSTESSIDANGYLLIKGIYNQKNIESILRKYVSGYVQCLSCKSLHTSIEKNSVTRLQFLVCPTCKSSRSLEQINTNYKHKK